MMQEDIFPAAEKILSDIENVLKKDPNLIGFEIIPALDNENKSPVIHAENALGLASWSVKPLYCYTYNRLLELRQNKHKREDPSTVSRWLLGALLLNPDVCTFWNMKRELVRSGRLDPMDELRFVSIVLYYKAKCFEAFAYRRWLVQFMLVENKQLAVNVESLLHNEISVATMSADRYANNYHAWSHREYVVTTFESVSPMNRESFLQIEWEKSGKWCSLHISDYSGFAYRQFLLKRLLFYCQPGISLPNDLDKCRELLLKFIKAGQTCGRNDLSSLDRRSCYEILNLLHNNNNNNNRERRTDIDYDWVLTSLSYWMEECTFNEELLNLYPGHEALWYHRRFLAYVLVALTVSYKKYSAYDPDMFVARRIIEHNDDRKDFAVRSTRSNLEMIFQSRNRDTVEIARRVGGHQSTMAERFVKFLASIGLEL